MACDKSCDLLPLSLRREMSHSVDEVKIASVDSAGECLSVSGGEEPIARSVYYESGTVEVTELIERRPPKTKRGGHVAFSSFGPLRSTYSSAM